MNPNQAQYLVKAPIARWYDKQEGAWKEQAFTGKTLGIQFNNGIAYLTPLTVPAHLHRTMDEIAVAFLRDWDYEVEAMTEEGQAVLDEWNAKKNTAAPATSGAMANVKPAPKLKRNAVVRGEGTYQVVE